MSNNPSQKSTEALQGRVLKYHSNIYTVEVLSEPKMFDESLSPTLYQCTLKGLLKKEGTSVITGDNVVLDNLDPINQTARIIQIQTRKNQLPRPKIANVDQVIIVHPFREPDFDYEQLNRFLTHTALAGVDAIICVSKSDLGQEEPEKARQEKEAITQLYQEQLNIPVIFTSIHDENSLASLKDKIKDKVSVLAGLSGAGKSSLLNRLNPNLEIKVQEVSEKISRGTHTTRHVELIHVSKEILIADTPGFSNLKFNTILPQNIEKIFPDFAPFRAHCSFANCLHLPEINIDDCAVQKDLESESPKTHPLRYTSYQALIAEALEYKKEQRKSSKKEEYGHKTIHAKGKEKKQIIRLKSKAREGSRRTAKQDFSTLVNDDLDDALQDFEND